MTKDRDFKRRVRERMAKTGESYTAARAHLLATTPPPLPADYLDLAGMSDEAVADRTGRSWPEWTAWLDSHRAAALSHPDIARLLGPEVPNGWWAQSVTGAYERIRGLRDHGQLRDGTYQSSRSRTIAVSAETLYRWVSEPDLRNRWIPAEASERKANPPKSMRLDWPDGTRVQLYIDSKGDEKSRIAVQHTDLPDADARDARREYWAERLDVLKGLLS